MNNAIWSVYLSDIQTLLFILLHSFLPHTVPTIRIEVYTVPVCTRCWCRLWPAPSGCRRSAARHPEAWRWWWCPQPFLRQTRCRCSHLLHGRKVRHEDNKGGTKCQSYRRSTLYSEHTLTYTHIVYDEHVNTNQTVFFMNQWYSVMCNRGFKHPNVNLNVCIQPAESPAANWAAALTERHMTGVHCCAHSSSECMMV